MALLICLGCNHPADEHHESGCQEILEMSDDGYPECCTCPRSVKAIYDEQWPRQGMLTDRAHRFEPWSLDEAICQWCGDPRQAHPSEAPDAGRGEG